MNDLICDFSPYIGNICTRDVLSSLKIQCNLSLWSTNNIIKYQLPKYKPIMQLVLLFCSVSILVIIYLVKCDHKVLTVIEHTGKPGRECCLLNISLNHRGGGGQCFISSICTAVKPLSHHQVSLKGSKIVFWRTSHQVGRWWWWWWLTVVLIHH